MHCDISFMTVKEILVDITIMQNMGEKILRLISLHAVFINPNRPADHSKTNYSPNKDILMKGSSSAHVEPSDTQSSGPSVTLESSKLSCFV